MLKIKILPITFKIVSNECTDNKVLPITFEIGTREKMFRERESGDHYCSPSI